MAEQLRVDELGRDRAAIDAAERTGTELGMLMDRARDDFFSRPGFAEQKDGRAAPGNHHCARHDGGKACIGANQPLLVRLGAAVDQVLGQGRGPVGTSLFL